MNEKNYKTNTNYFTKSDLLRPIAGALAAIGFLLYLFGFGYVSYILGSIFLPGAVVLFIIGSVGNASESDITDTIEAKTVDLEVRFEDDKRYATRTLHGFPPFIAEGHEYEDGLMVKRAKSGVVRTSKYTKSILYALEDALYVTERSFSLVDDLVENKVYDIPYAEIKGIEILRDHKTVTFRGKRFTVKLTQLAITRTDGEIIVFPVHDDIGSDEFVEKLLKYIDERKTETAK